MKYMVVEEKQGEGERMKIIKVTGAIIQNKNKFLICRRVRMKKHQDIGNFLEKIRIE